MADKATLLAEAYRRGLLTGEKKAAYEEAARRGLVPTVGGKRNAWGRAADVVANLNASIPLADEFAAGVDTAVNFLSGKPADIRQSMAKQRQMEERGMQNDRTASNLARGTGLAATMAVPGAPMVQGARGANIARGAVAGATEGALYGLTDRGSLKERVGAANKGAALGGVLGGVAGALIPATRATKAAKPKPVPLDELQAAKTRAYQAVDDAQVQFSDKAFNDLIDGVRDELKAAKISPRRHPKAFDMLQEMEESRGSMPTLTQLDQLRQVIRRDLGRSTDEAEQMFGQKMIANIDEFIDAAGPEQLVSKGGTMPGPVIRAAREANMRFKKVEEVEDALERATLRTGSTHSGGNIDNATRQELRRVLEKSRNLSPEEDAALREIVMGSPAQNVLRTVGRMSPTNGGWMALGGALLPTATAGAGLGPIGGALPIAGFAAKSIADRMTRQKVTNLLGLMGRGGKPAAEAEEQFFAIAEKNPQVRKLVAELIGRARRASVAATQDNQPAPNILATGTR